MLLNGVSRLLYLSSLILHGYNVACLQIETRAILVGGQVPSLIRYGCFPVRYVEWKEYLIEVIKDEKNI